MRDSSIYIICISKTAPTIFMKISTNKNYREKLGLPGITYLISITRYT